MTPKTKGFIVFPNHIAALGGASYVKYDDKSAWVTCAGKTIELRLYECADCLNDAFRLADLCDEFAYRAKVAS